MNRIPRYTLRLTVVVACVGLMITLMVWALQGAHPSVRRSSFEDERLIAYRAATDRGPTFPLRQDGGVVRVQSFLRLPHASGPTTYDPKRRYLYGLAFIVRGADGEVVERRQTWLETRNSKADWKDGRWQKAAAYYPAGGESGEPCDPRLTTVDLSDAAGPGRRLEIRLQVPTGDLLRDALPPPEPAEAELLVYRRFERPPDQRDWRRRTLSSGRQQELARRGGMTRWDELSETERDRTMRYGWERLSTVDDSPVRPLYKTDFRLPNDDIESMVGQRLTDGGRLAINLRGPTRLHIGLLDPDPTDEAPKTRRTLAWTTMLSTGDRASPLALHRGSANLKPATRTAPRTPGDLPIPSRTIIAIDEERAGTVDLHLSGGAPVRVIAWLEGASAPVGEAPHLPVGDNLAMTGPDWLTFTGWQVGPEQSPVTYLTAAEGQRIGDAVRVTARPLLESNADEPPALRYRFAGDSRQKTGTLPLEAADAPFERIEPAGDGDQPARRPFARLGEPSYHRLWIPGWAHRLELESERGSTLVDLSTILTGREFRESTPTAPYADPPTGLTWRYAPLRTNPWQPLDPENAADLDEAGRRRQIRAQTRLTPDWAVFDDRQHDELKSAFCPAGLEGCRWADELRDETTDDEAGGGERAVVLRPDRALQSAVIVEPADPTPSTDARLRRLAADWNPTYRLGLPANRPTRCQPPTDGRLAIDYRVEQTDLLGEGLEILWDGRAIESRMLRVDRDRIVVEVGADAGELTLQTAEDRGEGLRAYVACRPTEPTDADVYRYRTVARLAPGESLELTTYTTEAESPGINVVAYAPADLRRFRLHALVDDGAPARRQKGPVEQLTDPARFLLFDLDRRRSITLRRAPDTALAGPTRQFVPIGSDWQPGEHRLRLRLPQATAHPVWLRFFALVEDPELRRTLKGETER